MPARRLLSDFLRHDLGATGTHVGCEHGVCGACTVQIDGVCQDEPVSAQAVSYINRLSDFLFVAARYANGKGASDVLWVPGQNG